MKKIVIAFGVAVSALISNAAYLYWQVNEADYKTAEFDRVVVRYYNSESGSIDSGENGTFTQYYSLGDYNPSTEAATINTSTYGSKETLYTVDLSTLLNAENYSYYIELQSSTGGFVARTDVANAMTYTDLVSANAIFDAGLTAIPTDVTPWHGVSYSAVPEPTSALLMLFGAAMLGLKRKNRSIA